MDKRMSVKQIKQKLNLQMALDKTVLEQQSKALPSLDSMKETEHARARIHYIKDLLKEIGNWKSKKLKKK